MERGKVILSLGEDGVYSVVLDPPDPGGLHPTVQSFSDIREARGAWGGLRLCLGRRKVDLTGEG
tara:strand:+ start:1529 stop:1720 length:192 start_codon:yes stop_codon:yes gene_type:complete